MTSRPTVVLVPSWGSGHFMSALEAGKRLLATGRGAFTLTVLVMHAPSEAMASEVQGHVRREAASGLDIRFLQLPAVEHPTGCVDPVEFASRYVQLHAPHVKAAIARLGPSSRVAAAVVDLFLTALFDVLHELTVPAYVYFASPAAFLALMLRLPALREDLTGAGFEAMESTVDVPGLPPVPPSYMPACLVKAKIQSYDWFEYHGRRFMEARGVIVNTSVELESSILAAIADGQCVPGRPAPALHAIGPVVWFGSTDDQQPHECVRWLDAQPPASVVFLCFGSMGSLDAAQVREVAAGLERSGHRFLWVLRGPPVAGTRLPTDANLDEVLPEGFLEATAGRGLVWPAWAPQREILSHAAVGGFVTHCGWNSILESLWSGVPMIPWPLYGEQHLNAFELVAGVGAAVALEMDRRKGFFVEAAELERAVRSLMGGPSEEGRKARRTAAETSAACRKAVGEGGSSCAALQRLVREILVLPTEGNDSR
ncbi:anthocyanidin 3-O-glucosyltransferase 2-like [Triticum urartu]|uniref:Glycosyltransferase n=1 Tax=Triticum urartu TaxID=4572 RepID=A0A8R7PCP7_TRIUA|nr:anthocyanidin 3-O-glucosyltransferase 2-like [Triticum urartu]XP_048555836.1 anthocyanidin 3-O-glucosyltransferase 2-like [Triticum urartu]